MILLRLNIYLLILFNSVICYAFPHCDPYGNETDCNNAQDCQWDLTTSDCIPINQGFPDCINDCADFSSMTPQTNHTDWCNWLSGVWENGSASCMTDCSSDEMTKLTTDVLGCTTCLAASNCDQMMDDCNTYTTPADCPSDHCHWDPNAGTAGECHQEGPPDCVNDCADFNTMTPQTNHTDWCTWLSGVWEGGNASCMADCNSDEMTKLTTDVSGCTTCLAASNCEETHLSNDENSSFQPEYFSLHPIYPNPFNPTADIGFSLEYRGSVSISVYDITGRFVEKILDDNFRNSGSHIINWDGSEYPSGIYFIHMQAGKQIDIQKVTLLK